MIKLKRNYVALSTIVRKEIVRILRIWPQTLLPPVITMSLYFIIFGSLIGSRIGDMGGFDYMQFIVPGIIMMSIIMNSYMNTSSSFFSNKFGKSIEEILVSPTSNWVIIMGFVLGGIFRGLCVGLLVTVVSLFFTKLHIVNILVLISSVILTSILFSLAGMLNGIYARKFDDVTIIPTFVLTPLTYLGGVFYSISLLPTFWHTLSLANPILYMVNLFRYGFLGVSDVSILISYSMIFMFIIVFFFWANYLLKKGYGMRN